MAAAVWGLEKPDLWHLAHFFLQKNIYETIPLTLLEIFTSMLKCNWMYT